MLARDVKIKGDDNRPIIYRRRTIADLTMALQWAEKQEGTYWLSSARGRQQFCETDSLAHYSDMLINGWPEGLPDDHHELDGLASDAFEKQQFVADVGGAFPIVPAALAGHPMSMLNLRTLPSDNVRHVTLIIDSCFAARVRGDDVLRYAREVMRVIAKLAADGVDCSVYAVGMFALGANRQALRLYCTPIRQQGDVMQPERIASILHPSYLRRALFAMIEYEYYELKYSECCRCKNGFGSVMTPTTHMLAQVLPDATSIVMLPKVGDRAPEHAINEIINIKLKRN